LGKREGEKEGKKKMFIGKLRRGKGGGDGRSKKGIDNPSDAKPVSKVEKKKRGTHRKTLEGLLPGRGGGKKETTKKGFSFFSRRISGEEEERGTTTIYDKERLKSRHNILQ